MSVSKHQRRGYGEEGTVCQTLYFNILKASTRTTSPSFPALVFTDCSPFSSKTRSFVSCHDGFPKYNDVTSHVMKGPSSPWQGKPGCGRHFSANVCQGMLITSPLCASQPSSHSLGLKPVAKNLTRKPRLPDSLAHQYGCQEEGSARGGAGKKSSFRQLLNAFATLESLQK